MRLLWGRIIRKLSTLGLCCCGFPCRLVALGWGMQQLSPPCSSPAPLKVPHSQSWGRSRRPAEVPACPSLLRHPRPASVAWHGLNAYKLLLFCMLFRWIQRTLLQFQRFSRHGCQAPCFHNSSSTTCSRGWRMTDYFRIKIHVSL